nr:hypothetical protein Iba_chr04fCG11220 [Ipomoea batatas]
MVEGQPQAKATLEGVNVPVVVSEGVEKSEEVGATTKVSKGEENPKGDEVFDDYLGLEDHWHGEYL